jgi:hypothetical protein
VKLVLRLLAYVVALALFAAGAFVIGTHAGAALSNAASGGAEIGKLGVEELARLVLADAPGSPVWQLGVGAGLAALGLLLARPVARVTLGFRRPKTAATATKSLRSIAHDLGNPDPSVRLAAARTLTQLAKPATIPALVKALRDSKSEIRGQACEGLSKITGLTFDFVDIAPQSVRDESVKQWEAWWQTHKAAILAGRDPRSVGTVTGLEPAPVPVAEAPEPEAAPGPELPPPDEELPPPPADVEIIPEAVDDSLDKTPAKPMPAVGLPAQPESKGRNVSVGDLVRRKRQHQGSPPQAPPAAVDKGSDAPSGWPLTARDAEEGEDDDLPPP